MSQATLVQCHQVDDHGVYMFTRERRSYGFRHVAVAPPAIPEGKLARWESPVDPTTSVEYSSVGAWVVTSDNRKIDLYTDAGKYVLGSEYQGQSFDGIGEIPSWLTSIAKPSSFHNLVDGVWVLDVEAELAAAKTAKQLQIDAARDLALNGGFVHNGHTYQSDSKSIQRISAIATLSLMDPNYSTPYITADNTIVILDAVAIGSLGLAAAQHEATLVFQARTLKDQVLAATTKAEVDVIQWVAP